MRKVVLTIALVGLLLPMASESGAAAASSAAPRVVRTGATCGSLSLVPDPVFSYLGTAVLGKCSNRKATGGSGQMPGNSYAPPFGSSTITWGNGKTTTADWTWNYYNVPDEHEALAHSCAAPALIAGWSYVPVEVAYTGTVTADTTGGFPVGSSVSGEVCWFENDALFVFEPGSKLVFS